MFGPGFEYIYEELDKISNIFSEDTEEMRKLSEDSIEKKFDWTPLYGELESGKYEFILTNEKDSTNINVAFTIDDDGNVSYNEPEIFY